MHFDSKYENNANQISRFCCAFAQWLSRKVINHSYENVSRYWRLSSYWFWVGQTVLSLERRHCRKSQFPLGQNKNQKHGNQFDQKVNLWNRYQERNRNWNFSQVWSHGWMPRQRRSYSNQNVYERHRAFSILRKHSQQTQRQVLD